MSEQETEALRREIERTRAELGATVEALSHKADVKAHVRERPVAPIAAGIAVALVALFIIRRRRS
jgi:Protein of unknown function (DUF3618)